MSNQIAKMKLSLFAIFCSTVVCSAGVVPSESCTASTTTYTHYKTYQHKPTPLAVQPEPETTETTKTTTITSTITSTSTTIQTNTREIPCPAVSTGVLNFDDLPTRGVSPMPLIYNNFTFLSPGWQYYTYTSSPPHTPSYRAIPASSHPNALTTRSQGFLSIGTVDKSFSFDFVTAQVFAFTNDGAGDILHLQFELIYRYGEVQTIWRTIENGFSAGKNSTLAEFGKGDAGRWVDLAEIKVAAWEKFDNSTGEGKSAMLVLDDVKYQERVC
ncbi:hypothetical protein L873DRAFT_1044155 [Choiromyces venosus 120613-1]|uniref:Concanavalin A-like lectin/glucanase n=1 Tax=Choiromyces venosus 120613-1 TaxID=1336337 RepID=A0A3N4JQL2_9PEZI|nr:hypothetical protein L873DRAFT_1044155 [Choiromyces venosus 120613-1]